MRTAIVLMLYLGCATAFAQPQDPNLWAGVIGTKLKADGVEFLRFWSSRGSDPKEVQKVLEKACRESSNPKLCHIFVLSNKGCWYFATGINSIGKPGASFGNTPQEAYDKCYFEKGLDCSRHTTGGCANPNDDAPSLDATNVMPSHPYWIAFAYTLGVASDGRKVPAGGLGFDPDRDEATRKAIKRCEEEGDKWGGKFKCEFYNDYSSGCQYGATGVSATLPGKLFTGRTKELALRRCSYAGYDCSEESTFGACVNIVPASKY